MKKSFYFIFLIFITITSCQQTIVKIPEKDVDKIKVNKFKKIVISYFKTLEAGETFDFKNVANKEFNEKMTSAYQLKTYFKIKQEFGELEILKFNGIWTEKTEKKLEIIRFKCRFSKSNKEVEIRVVINSLEKVIGFWVKPWKNNLNPII